MSVPTIKIEGTDALMMRLGRFRPAVKAALKAVGMSILGVVKTYPEQVEGARYRRTMKLEKSWNMRESGDLGVVIGSSTDAVPYNRKVMDAEEQADIHGAHGWRTVQDIAEEWRPKVVDEVHEAIETALDK